MEAVRMSSWGNSVMYSMFIRNQGGGFREAEKRLESVRALGTDILWLLPVHPIGKQSRKGTLGSPYAIMDYRRINPEYGTMEDFQHFVEHAHALGMKVIIDVVFHHTSPDSALATTHPEWFYHRPDGSFGNHVGDWSDIIDLEFANKGLWDELTDTLCMWAQWVDGFRCDVAPLVPVAFWQQARQAVEKVREKAFWLAESVEPAFIRELCAMGEIAHSDEELYQAFDVLYDYDLSETFYGYFQGKCSLQSHISAVAEQENRYPDGYLKLRFLENHDRMRSAELIPDEHQRMNWLAFSFFQRGIPLIYAGQECAATHCPSLFDSDPIPTQEDPATVSMIHAMTGLRKMPEFNHGRYSVRPAGNACALVEWKSEERTLTGLFCLANEAGRTAVNLRDGLYRNLITGSDIPVSQGTVDHALLPAVFEGDTVL